MDSNTNIAEANRNLALIPILILSFSGILTAFFDWSTPLVIVQFMCMLVISVLFFINHRFFIAKQHQGKLILIYFFIYGCLVFIHSLFVANSYEQWSYLVNVFAPFLILPFFAIIATDTNLLFNVLKIILRVTLPISLFFFIKGAGDKGENLVYIAFVSPIFLYLIFLPLLKIKWKLMIFLISCISWFWDGDNRSNLLNILFSYLLLFTCLAATKFSIDELMSKILTFLMYFLLLVPILLVFLGVLDIFNIFEFLDSGINIATTSLSDEAGRYLTTDSRTGIYVDALMHLYEKNEWLFGGSAVVIYATHLVASSLDYEMGRLGGSESGFLGLLMFGGLIYSLLFFLLCHKSSKLAIFNSNNIYIKIIGIYVAYKWLFIFIEMPLGMNFSWIVLFIAIGMTFNSDLRLMSNNQISEFFLLL